VVGEIAMLRILSISFCFLFCFQAVQAMNNTTFYVSLKGNNAWSGKLIAPNAKKTDGPFATLTRARDAARTAKAKGSVVVKIRGGVYRLEKSFELSANDSGIPDKPVVYRNYGKETPRLVGGIVIPASAFRPVDDPGIIARLDTSSRGNILQVDLKSLGLRDFGEAWESKFCGYAGWPELYFQDKRMQIARWPNEGFTRMGKVLEQGSQPRYGETPDRPGKFQYDGNRPERWLAASEVYLDGYWCYKWYCETIKIAKIDPAEKSITFSVPALYGVGGFSGGEYYAINLLEELDSPGEYYLDRQSGILYFWPPEPVKGKSIAISMLKAPLVSMNGVSDVSLVGITLEFARGSAIDMKDCNRSVVAGCTIKNIAENAINISGGVKNGVVSCDLFELGGGGITLSGGDRTTLTPGKHYAVNNHIHHYGRLYRTHRPAISLSGVGCSASHNLIHDAPHHGMDFYGNDHLIDYNIINHVCMETDDAGAVYNGRDWTARGTVLRYNFIHDIGGGPGIGNQGIYLDDCLSGITSYGNILVKIGRGFLINGGRDNVVDNNILVDCSTTVHITNQGVGEEASKGGNWPEMIDKLNAVPYKSDIWQKRYPKIAGLLEDQPGSPKYNVIENNLMYRCGSFNLAPEATEYGTIKDNWETKDTPGFVDPDTNNYALKSDSQVYKNIPGFKPIPFEKIGLYQDEFRKDIPANGGR